jgi:hypothetical protein
MAESCQPLAELVRLWRMRVEVKEGVCVNSTERVWWYNRLSRRLPLKAEDSALYVRLWRNLCAFGGSPDKQLILSAKTLFLPFPG